MTRSPRVDSARRFFRSAKSSPDAKSGFHRPARLAHAAVTVGFGLAVSCTGGLAQNAAKRSADHIKARTSAGDLAPIKGNTAASQSLPAHRLDHAEDRFSQVEQ